MVNNLLTETPQANHAEIARHGAGAQVAQLIEQVTENRGVSLEARTTVLSIATQASRSGMPR